MEWKPVPGFEDYEIAEDGTIRSKDRYVMVKKLFKGQIIKTNNRNYVILRKDGKSFNKTVKHLLMEAFEGIKYEPKYKNNRKMKRTMRW